MTGFVAATAVQRDEGKPGDDPREGRYAASIPEDWNSPFGLHGGVFAATAARATDDAHGVEGLELRSVHARYLERPASPHLEIDTTVTRTGGISAFVDANARGTDADRVALQVGSLFTRKRAGIAFLEAEPPAAPPPADCDPMTSPASARGAVGPAGPSPIFANLEVRPVIGVYPWDAGWTPDQPARHLRWGRFVQRPELSDGGLDPLAMLVWADLPASALWVRLTPDDSFHTTVSLDLTFHVLERPSDEWFLVDTRARWAGDSYLLTETDIWSGGRLCVTSNQMMLVRVLG